jgi:hypothetical protein
MDEVVKRKDKEIATLKELLSWYREHWRLTNEQFIKQVDLYNAATIAHHKYLEHCMIHHLNLPPTPPSKQKFPEFDFANPFKK